MRLNWSSPRTRDTHTYCRAFGCVAATIYFNDYVYVAAGIRTPNLPLAGFDLFKDENIGKMYSLLIVVLCPIQTFLNSTFR